MLSDLKTTLVIPLVPATIAATSALKRMMLTLPGIDEAFRCGMISYSKVRAMTRSATPENKTHH